VREGVYGVKKREALFYTINSFWGALQT